MALIREGSWALRKVVTASQGSKGGEKVVGRDGPGSCRERKGEGKVREWGGAGESTRVLRTGSAFTQCAPTVCRNW